MKSFELGNLIINAEEQGNTLIFSWQGKSDNKELINVLEPYYTQAKLVFVHVRRTTCIFKPIKVFNSSLKEFIF
jgi:hypothetical protein